MSSALTRNVNNASQMGGTKKPSDFQLISSIVTKDSIDLIPMHEVLGSGGDEHTTSQADYQAEYTPKGWTRRKSKPLNFDNNQKTSLAYMCPETTNDSIMSPMMDKCGINDSIGLQNNAIADEKSMIEVKDQGIGCN